MLTLSVFMSLFLSCPAPPPPPRSSSRVNDQAQQLMLLSSLTAAALASARNASSPGPATVMRSNSVPVSGHPGLKSKPPPPPPITDNCMLLNQASIDSVDSQDVQISDSNSSLASIDSQNGRSRQQLLEDRHQELLKKQKLLQDQYTQLQILSRGQQGLLNDLKKTGSESNIVSKSGIGVNSSGSLSQLIPDPSKAKTLPLQQTSPAGSQLMGNGSNQMSHTNGNQVKQGVNNNLTTVQMNNNQGKHVETQKIYETDIL